MFKKLMTLLRKAFLMKKYNPFSFRSSNEIPEYVIAFNNAVRFTRSLGLTCTELNANDTSLIDLKGDVFDRVASRAGISDPRKSAGQCLKWCHWLAPHLALELGVSVQVTVGHLWHGNEPVYSPSWSQLQEWVERGVSIQDLMPTGLKVHAWLTAENGEIIDPTLPSSLAAVNGGDYQQFAGGVFWGFDPKAVYNHRYFPMLIGQEAVERINGLSVMPLLAASLKDLPVSIMELYSE